MRPNVSLSIVSLSLLGGLTFSACGSEGGSELLPDGGTPPPPANLDCVPPGTPGNSLDVGKSCTKGGHECNLFAFAKFCTLDFRDNVPGFCTTTCSADADCGSGAVCGTNPDGSGQRGCTPVACIPPAGVAPPTGGGSTPAADAGTADQCVMLSACCAAPGFPAKSLDTCQKSVATTGIWCEVVRKTYELEGDCPAAN